MTTSTAPTDTAETYLAEVRRHLADLADLTDDERDDLLDDLAAHVHEVATGDHRPLADVLGTPQAFAAELVASAGLARRRRPGRVDALAGAVDRTREALMVTRNHPWARPVLGFLPELRPAWWVARGWLLVYGLWLVTDDDYDSFPLPELLETTELGVIAGLAASVLSVWLARRAHATRWRAVVNALAIASAVLLLTDIDDIERAGQYDTVIYDSLPPSNGLTAADGRPITNIHPFDASGQPLDDVRLYDQSGRPIEILDPVDGRLRSEVTPGADGLPVPNLYPLDQYTTDWSDQEQAEVHHPVPTPVLSVPPLTVPTTGEPSSDTSTSPAAPGS